MWPGLMDWMKSKVLEKELFHEYDFDNIYLLNGVDEVLDVLRPMVIKFYENHEKRR